MPTTKPQGVVPSDPSVSLFGNIVKEAYGQLGTTLSEADYSTPTRRTEILKQVKQIVDQSDEATQAWVRLNIGGFYELGLWESGKDLNERGSNVRFDADFSHFHQEALEAIAQDTYSSIASGMQGLNGTAERMVSMGAREQILAKIGRGQITGEANRDIQKLIQEELRKAGITALRDKGGVEWDLSRYSEMLVRTKLTQAHNTGVANRMVESGYDLVVVSNHMGACKLCAPWEGKVLSLTGRNPSHISVDMARQGGLFHPNCRHVFSPYHDKYLDVAVAWDAKAQKYRPYQQIRASVIKDNKAKIQKAVTTTSFAKAYKDNIQDNQAGAKFEYGSKQYELSAFEADLVKRRGLEVTESKQGNRYGAYSADENKLIYNPKTSDKRTPKENEHTFRHEVGHFIDYRYNDPQPIKMGNNEYSKFIKRFEMLSDTPEFNEVVKAHGAQVIKNRIATYGIKNINDDNIHDLYLGLSVDLGGTNYKLPASHLKYLRQYKEIFADGYAQFKLDPDKVQKTMPELYNYFKKLESSINL